MNLPTSSDYPLILHGDCVEEMRQLPEASVHAVVTDPPYGINFMGKAWDAPGGMLGQMATGDEQRGDNAAFGAWCETWLTECLRVLKPGGHLLAFGGTRTWHRLACAVEDAGFEIRDSIAWLYGSGFPKSLDVSKAIDKVNGEAGRLHKFTAWMRSTGVTSRELDIATGTNMGGHYLTAASQPAIPTPALWAKIRPMVEDVPEWVDLLVERVEAEREVIGTKFAAIATPGDVDRHTVGGSRSVAVDITAPATDAAREWAGFGTALKPAHEPVVWARKPLNAVPLWSEATALHHMIGGLLWLSLSPAKRAELTSTSSPAVQPAGTCVSALVTAATATSPGGFAETGTCSSPATASTSSSIASSWSSILGALSDPTSTSTTSMKSSTTTALTTLSSLLAPLTSPSTMPQCGCLTSGSSSSAPSAAETSTDEWANWLHTLSASVPASAIEGTALVAASALAQAAAALSTDRPESSAAPTATTGAGASPSPAFEPVVVARKPLIGTVAANVLAHGTGALNIDGCRIEHGGNIANADGGGQGAGYEAHNKPARIYGKGLGGIVAEPHTSGRWPANVVLDESQAGALDEQSGEASYNPPGRFGTQRVDSREQGSTNIGPRGEGDGIFGYGDRGGASRFFYVAKADASERPRLPKRSLRLRDDLTPEQVDHVRARLVEAGVQVD